MKKDYLKRRFLIFTVRFLPRKRKGKYSRAHRICLEKCDDYSKRFWSKGCKSSKKVPLHREMFAQEIKDLL
jgi:hypothetical protein